MVELQNPEVLRAVLDSLRTGVVISDRNGTIVFWNEGAEHIAGFARHDVIGRSYQQSILRQCQGHTCKECSAECPFSRALHDGKPVESRLQLDHKHGHKLPVLMRVSPIRDAHGSIIATAASFEAQRWHPEIRRDQRRPVPHECVDDVTGTASHGFTDFNLKENLASFSEYHIPFSIVHVQAREVGHFRAAYGQQAYDAVLRVLATNLTNTFRPSDFVGRWGQDEFVAILGNCSGIGAERAFERVRSSVSSVNISWWGEQIFLKVAVGYASVEPGDSINSLLERAKHIAAADPHPSRATLISKNAAAGSQG
jgi:diguanylate cyclase (GGDEF)-like protein/PAS domain S-box-containing protein